LIQNQPSSPTPDGWFCYVVSETDDEAFLSRFARVRMNPGVACPAQQDAVLERMPSITTSLSMMDVVRLT